MTPHLTPRLPSSIRPPCRTSGPRTMSPKRLVEAFATLDRLPGVKGPRAPGQHWPPAQSRMGGSARAGRTARKRAGASAWSFAIRLCCAPARRISAGWNARSNGYAICAPPTAASPWLRASGPSGRPATGPFAGSAVKKAGRRGTFYKLRAKALEQLAAGLNARGTAVF